MKKNVMDPSVFNVEAKDTGKPSVARFTPGPWWYQEKSDAYTHIVRAGENRFITQFGQDRSGTSEANARLTAAAPELYEALALMLVHGEASNWFSGRGDDEVCEQARTALAKAMPQTVASIPSDKPNTES